MTGENRLVGNRYRLGKRIGVGGMGRVWLARDEVLRREVAVKEVLLPETPTEDEAHELRQRTLREARAAARLAHPNVVRVYDVMYADDRPWIVMEYVPSRSLAQVIKSDGPMRPDEAAVVGIAVLDALCAAHAAGVLHRDVKPGNVLLAEDGRVVLTDFGLATFDEIGTALTQSGIVHGSPQFIAPERALDGTSTVEADMWSLGATLFAAVEGQSPYARSTSYQTLAALATAPPDAPKRAGALKPVLAGLLRRKPASRMKPDEIRARLVRIAHGESGLGPFWSRHQNSHGADGGSSGNIRLPSAAMINGSAPVGPTGAAGAAGPTGAAGATGAPGAPGAPGGTMTRDADAGPIVIPSQSTGPSGGRDESSTEQAASSVGDPGPAGGDGGRGSAGGHGDGAGATHGSAASDWHRAATTGAVDDRPGDIGAGDAMAASEAWRHRPIEWRSANGNVVRSTSDTREEIDEPRRNGRRRRLAAIVVVIVLLLAGGGYLLARQLTGSSKPNRQALPPTGAGATGPTAPVGSVGPPGSVAPSGSTGPSGVPLLSDVKWLCDPQRPLDAVPLPLGQTDYHGHTAYPSFTWFMFAPDFPITLPSSFQIAYSRSTACLYDSTSPARMINIHRWTPTGAAATDAQLDMQTYRSLARTLGGYQEVNGIAAAPDLGKSSTSATMDYTYVGAAGRLHTFARVYLVEKTAYLISWTTAAANAASDSSVYDVMQASVLLGQMPR